jgi:hypothetical protein
LINPIYYCGIDPGQVGGIGILDRAGGCVAAHRWNKREPVKLFNILSLIKDMVDIIYIEDVRIFPRESKGFITSNQGLLTNCGIWQGWMIALQIRYQLIPMATWQAACGLSRWRTQPRGHSPLTLARQLWPAAPLAAQADDGCAVGLLLGDLARRDHLAGIDRAQLAAAATTKRKAVKARIQAMARTRAKQQSL